MAIINTSANRRIDRNRQSILVNKWGSWSSDSDVLCESINRGIGTAGSSANFIIPRMKWDEARDRYTGAEVLVYASENNSFGMSSQPWFHGWIVSEPKKLSATSNSYTFSAVSAIQLLDKIPVGLGSWTFRDWNGVEIISYSKKGIGAKYPRLSTMRYGTRVPLWHPKDVLTDIFEGLPSFWKSAIRLGNMEVFQDDEPYKKQGLVEWDFSAVSVLEALETLVSCWGDIEFVENSNGTTIPRVELDFYRIGDSSRGSKNIYVPSCGGGIGVQEIGGNTEVNDRIDRVILAGAPYKTMITAWTGDLDPARRLRKGWVTKPLTITITSFDDETNEQIVTDVTKTNEEWVLDDPDYGRRDSDLFHPDCEWVFRRYYLPPCLIARGLSIEKENAVRQLQSDPDANEPKAIGQQLFKTRLTYSTRRTDYELAESLAAMGQLTSSYGYDCAYEYGEGYGYQTATGFRLLNLSQADLVGEVVPDLAGETYTYPLELLDGFEIGADGTIVVNEPVCNIIYKGYCGTKEQIVRAEADVAITITVAREDRLTMDTGQPPYQPGGMSLIGKDGMCLTDVKDTWEYSQITNLGAGPRLETGEIVTFPFIDPASGTPVYFDYCVYALEYDPDADDPELVKIADNEEKILTHVTSQQVIRNDYATMQELGRRLLKLKSRPTRTYDITLPVATRGYLPGDRVRPQGIDDLVYDDYTVSDVSIKFDPTGTGFSTVVNVTNAKPEATIKMER